MRTLFVAALLAMLGGCQLEEYALSETEKINRAFPLPAEVDVMRARLADSLAAQPEQAKRFGEEFAQLLDVRAVTCRSTAVVSRFDDVAAVRRKLADASCFKKQDADLATWLGLRRLAGMVALPPLKPLQPLPAKVTIQSIDNVTQLAVAARAGVALARTSAGRLATLDLTGGKPIHEFAGPGEVHRPPSAAPNGRVAAFPIGNRALQVVDLESGSTVWATEKYSEVLGWLPEAQALVLAESGVRKAALLDLRSGQAQPYVADERGIAWTLDAPGGPGLKLVGSSGAVSLIEHERRADGSLAFEVRKQWALAQRMSANTPMLLRGGKLLVYMAHPDLAWLDLESGQQGTWATSLLRIYNLAKLDENHLAFFDQRQPQGLKVLNVEQMTIASVPDVTAEGYAVSFAPRSGLARHVSGTLVVHTQVQPQDALPLDKVLADLNLQDQLRKAEAAQGTGTGERTSYSAHEIAAAEAEARAATAAVQRAEAMGLPASNRQAYVELVARQVRMMNAASGMRDGLPRHVVDRTRAGDAARAAPMLAEVPANAEVSVLGVYQAEDAQRTSGQGRVPGMIRVTLGRGSTPLVLVLSSYEPVRWVVSNPGGRRVAAVLLSSYHSSEVVGLSGVQVLRIGQQYAYKAEGTEFTRLRESVGRYVAAPVKTFQGAYQARQFSVGM